MKKILVIGVVLLFFGVTFAPSVQFLTVKASNEKDYVDVVTEPCGVNGKGNTTVRLTRQQYNELHEYLANFNKQLNQSTNKKDALNLVRNAVGTLYHYGLIPKTLSVEQAQALATRNFIPKTINHIQGFADVNLFCLIGGQLQFVNFIPGVALPFIIVGRACGLLFELLYGLYQLAIILYYMFGTPGLLFFLIDTLIGLPGSICFDVVEKLIEINRPYPFAPFDYVNSIMWDQWEPYGYIGAFGLLGVVEREGSFYPKIFGFTGFKIQIEDEQTFFVGSAIYMSVR